MSETEPTFSAMGLDGHVVAALARMGLQTPSAIQSAVIPPVMAGRDVEARAGTGSGKTVAFAAPIISTLAAQAADNSRVRCLVLSPTRELAGQIAGVLRGLARGTGLRVLQATGGTARVAQARTLADGVAIVVGTPGRVSDLVHGGELGVSAIGSFVLDEADRMLDPGFAEEMLTLAAVLPPKHQTLLFSATIPPAMAELATRLLHRPERISMQVEDAPTPRIAQYAIFVPMRHKAEATLACLRQYGMQRVMVFVRTRQEADSVARAISALTPAIAIHGEHSQAKRERMLRDFRQGRVGVLVATDVMARGIDIDDVALVINHDIPPLPESYVHRIGRTARAGRRGMAVALCAPEERLALKEIERLTGQRIRIASLPE
ncbi:DEAD/DEAH box helicase [Komagataeibacter medellinensis]|uniref:RNA helicase n=1 Tax=Komagataeibacter medellinensis (strain NBRC 3288 / BCRC 11682 / LMG 1693 / Kondo 51) TaxID=634177 RepID=G2I4H0_KOMMN|nr:DEAD/DEAH box helicase [Komagataeibacter medellinensis]BAK83017.1 RNA helicase [Komagataeibacter medellinensis NBRC 3288]